MIEGRDAEDGGHEVRLIVESVRFDPFLRRAVVLRLLVLVLTTVVASACAEAAFRWHVWRRFELKFPRSTENLVRLPAPQVFEFKPNATGVFPGGVDPTRTFPYRTNAHGLRDRDRSEKGPGTRRVLVIGDSYTWGYAVAEEEAYPQVAERLLKERGHPEIEVINGGDSGLQQSAGAAASGAAHAGLRARCGRAVATS